MNPATPGLGLEELLEEAQDIIDESSFKGRLLPETYMSMVLWAYGLYKRMNRFVTQRVLIETEYKLLGHLDVMRSMGEHDLPSRELAEELIYPRMTLSIGGKKLSYFETRDLLRGGRHE